MGWICLLYLLPMGIMLEVMLCLLCTNNINIGEVKYITEMLRLWAEHETNGDAIDVSSVGTFYVMLG